MSATTATTHSTILPPENLEPMLDLSRFLDQVAQPAALIGPDGQTVGLPMEAYRVLVDGRDGSTSSAPCRRAGRSPSRPSTSC